MNTKKCVDYGAFGTQRRSFGVEQNSMDEGEIGDEGESTRKHPVTIPG